MIKIRNADLRTYEPPKNRDSEKKTVHFLLAGMTLPRAPLSTPECGGMFVGTPGMIAVRYQRVSGRVRAL